MLLIIDNQSSYIKSFKRNFLSEQKFSYMFFDHNQPINLPPQTKVSGIILSGGKGTPYEPLNLTSDFVALMNFDVPVLGICLGHEIIAVSYMGKIKRLPATQDKRLKITITKSDDLIFKGLDKKEVYFRRRHYNYVSKLPEDFLSLGKSEISNTEIIKHKNKPIYGFQSHPEVSGEEGLLVMKNFLRMCNIKLEES